MMTWFKIKDASERACFYYMYLSEMNDEDKIKEAIETLLQEEDTLTLDTVAKRLDKINARPSLRRRKPSSPFCGKMRRVY